ncbi:MAG: O-antigen polysaccharide polymerase Wzy [Firmicutes bacterium]|nr:O-antigen polysaccharide polymerase Wzy [Bacillota bacterium]
MKQKKRMIIVAAYLITLGLLIAFILSVTGLTLRAMLLVAIALTLLLPMTIRAATKGLDLFEPVVISNVALGVMFLGRPLSDLLTGETTHLGYSILGTFNEALLVALVGTVCFEMGYFGTLGSVWARRLPKPPPFQPERAAAAGWLYFFLGGALFSLFLATQGGVGILKSLLAGRQQSHNELFLSSTGYLYNGIAMWAATALIFFAVAWVGKRHAYRIWFIFPTAFLLMYYGASGARSQLLPLALSIPVFWYLWKGKRPRLLVVIIVLLVGISLLGWMRETRNADAVARQSAGQALITALISPVQQAEEIFTGSDAEMFDSMTNELLILPDQTSFQHGATITDVLVRMVPRPLWPNKPLESNDIFVSTLWPEHYAASRAAPAFSVIGVFYADSGYLTVALGMLLIGVLFSMLWHWLQLFKTEPIAQMIYAMGLPFAIILMRGTIPDTLSRMLFLFVPLLLLIWGLRIHIRASEKRGRDHLQVRRRYRYQ